MLQTLVSLPLRLGSGRSCRRAGPDVMACLPDAQTTAGNDVWILSEGKTRPHNGPLSLLSAQAPAGASLLPDLHDRDPPLRRSCPWR